jgi:hypothetical protein
MGSVHVITPERRNRLRLINQLAIDLKPRSQVRRLVTTVC